MNNGATKRNPIRFFREGFFTVASRRAVPVYAGTQPLVVKAQGNGHNDLRSGITAGNIR